jgi:hypothetical protein
MMLDTEGGYAAAWKSLVSVIFYKKKKKSKITSLLKCPE